MSQSDMQHQATVDGGASTIDGYIPAVEAPPPATGLLDLLPELLDDIACRVMQLGARSLLPLTCRAFSLAHLLHAPALRIQLGRQCCDQLLTPRVVAALQARKSKLALTLWQPETEDGEGYRKQWAPTLQLLQTEYTQDYTDLLAHALAKLDNCAAVEVCKLVSSGANLYRGRYHHDEHRHLHCPPGLAQHLLDSFPSLTALTLEGLNVPNALSSLHSHPPLSLQLQQLHLTHICLMVGDAPRAIGPLFHGLFLKQLSITAVVWRGGLGTLQQRIPPPVNLPSFQSLAQHLTQLHFFLFYPQYGEEYEQYMVQPEHLVEYFRPLAQLQVLTLLCPYKLEGLAQLLQVLPQLHTLQLPDVTVRGQQELNTLLAATQLTSLQLRTVEALNNSCADAPCSWQRLELTGTLDFKVVAYLPLLSLSQPLVLGKLAISVRDIPDPVVAMVPHLFAQACKVPVMIKGMDLWTRSLRYRHVITPALLQQQNVELAKLVAMLQPLPCRGKVQVYYLHGVTAADVAALAPLCRECTHFELCDGSMEPSLEFWRQLMQLMPAVQKVQFRDIKGCISAAMHESLQLMAEQPWARWLDIAIRYNLPGL